MKENSPPEPRMDSPGTYQIAIRGILAEQWSDWFNGTIISIRRNPGESPTTMLTCKVRDQAELFGILNRLNSLNLPLLQAAFLNSLEILEEAEKDKTGHV